MTQPTTDPIPSPDDRPHKPADDTEMVYYEGSPLLRGDIEKLFGWGLLGMVFIAGGVISFIYNIWPLGIALVVLGIIFFIVPIILVRTVRYRISNYRIDYERGLFSRKIDTLELWHVEDLSFFQSFFDRLMGCGDIKIISHDETTPQLLLRGLPNPRPLFENLKQRIIAVKRQRGVIKMDMG
jgi:hypothetical protein